MSTQIIESTLSIILKSLVMFSEKSNSINTSKIRNPDSMITIIHEYDTMFFDHTECT